MDLRRRAAPALAAIGVAALGASGCDPHADSADAVPGAWACRSSAPIASSSVSGRFEVEDAVTSASDFILVGDCNGDGRLDLVADERLLVQAADGRFEPPRDLLAVPASVPAGRATAAALVDLDGDGILDLVLAGDGVATFRGAGDCTFGGARIVEPHSTGTATQVLVHDVDGDGLADLTVSRTGRSDAPFELLLARGDGSFEDRTPAPTPLLPLASSPAPGSTYRTFGVFFDDVDGDGAQDLFAIVDTSHAWFSWGVAGDLPAFAVDPYLTELFGDDSPMSVSPIAPLHDGAIAYFASKTFGKNRLFRVAGDRTVDDLSCASGVGGGSDDAWGSVSLDADLDGFRDLLFLRQPDDNVGTAPSALLMNRGDGTFGNAAPAALDLRVPAKVLTCGDLAGDGAVGCAVMTDPHDVLVLRDRIAPAGRWVGVRLRGTVSSVESSGARVSLDGERSDVVVAGGQSPTWAQHAGEVVLAVGSRDSARVRIAWPSGIVQAVDAPAGRYTTVVEPAAVTVSARVLPAGGASCAEVIVDPASAGAGAATIDRSGDGTWSGPATRGADGRLHRSLCAPASPGRARIEVSLDGTPLRVRPRIRFE